MPEIAVGDDSAKDYVLEYVSANIQSLDALALSEQQMQRWRERLSDTYEENETYLTPLQDVRQLQRPVGSGREHRSPAEDPIYLTPSDSNSTNTSQQVSPEALFYEGHVPDDEAVQMLSLVQRDGGVLMDPPSPVDQQEDYKRCPSCKILYDIKLRRPLVQPCFHLICRLCYCRQHCEVLPTDRSQTGFALSDVKYQCSVPDCQQASTVQECTLNAPAFHELEFGEMMSPLHCVSCPEPNIDAGRYCWSCKRKYCVPHDPKHRGANRKCITQSLVEIHKMPKKQIWINMDAIGTCNDGIVNCMRHSPEKTSHFCAKCMHLVCPTCIEEGCDRHEKQELYKGFMEEKGIEVFKQAGKVNGLSNCVEQFYTAESRTSEMFDRIDIMIGHIVHEKDRLELADADFTDQLMARVTTLLRNRRSRLCATVNQRQQALVLHKERLDEELEKLARAGQFLETSVKYCSWWEQESMKPFIGLLLESNDCLMRFVSEVVEPALDFPSLASQDDYRIFDMIQRMINEGSTDFLETPQFRQPQLAVSSYYDQSYQTEHSPVHQVLAKYGPDSSFGYCQGIDAHGRPEGQVFAVPLAMQVPNAPDTRTLQHMLLADGSTTPTPVRSFDGAIKNSEVNRVKITYTNRFGEFGVGSGQFTEPSGVCSDSRGRVYIADTNNHRIQVFDRSGLFIRSIGTEKIDGNAEKTLRYPNRVEVTPGEDIVVTERAPTHQIQVFDQNGGHLSRFGAENLQHPRGLCIDSAGQIIIVECKVMRVTIFSPCGDITAKFSLRQFLEFPNGVAANYETKQIFISDNRAHCVWVFSYQGEYVNRFGKEGVTNYPIGVALTKCGNVIVADNHNNFNLTVYTQAGVLLKAFESKSKHMQVLDICVMHDNCVAIACKDYKVYIYKWSDTSTCDHIKNTGTPRQGQQTRPRAVESSQQSSPRTSPPQRKLDLSSP